MADVQTPAPAPAPGNLGTGAPGSAPGNGSPVGLGMKRTPRRTVCVGGRGRGFTLIEVVVVVVLIGILGGVASVIMRQAVRARDRTDAAEKAYAEANRALNEVVDALRNRLLLPEDTDAEDRQLEFEIIDGELNGWPSDQLRLFTVDPRPVRLGQAESDVREVAFTLVMNDDTQTAAFTKRTDPTLNEEPDGGGVIDRLCELASFSVRCYDGEGWLEQWEVGQEGQVEAVQVSVTVIDSLSKKPTTYSRLVTWPHRSGGTGASGGAGGGFETGGGFSQALPQDAKLWFVGMHPTHTAIGGA